MGGSAQAVSIGAPARGRAGRAQRRGISNGQERRFESHTAGLQARPPGSKTHRGSWQAECMRGRLRLCALRGGRRSFWAAAGGSARLARRRARFAAFSGVMQAARFRLWPQRRGATAERRELPAFRAERPWRALAAPAGRGPGYWEWGREHACVRACMYVRVRSPSLGATCAMILHGAVRRARRGPHRRVLALHVRALCRRDAGRRQAPGRARQEARSTKGLCARRGGAAQRPLPGATWRCLQSAGAEPGRSGPVCAIPRRLYRP